MSNKKGKGTKTLQAMNPVRQCNCDQGNQCEGGCNCKKGADPKKIRDPKRQPSIRH